MTTPSTVKDPSTFEEMTDEAITELARCNDGDALEFLLNKYKNFVRAKARSYFLIGADREEIVQEGMIVQTNLVSCLCGALRYAPDHHSH